MIQRIVSIALRMPFMVLAFAALLIIIVGLAGVQRARHRGVLRTPSLRWSRSLRNRPAGAPRRQSRYVTVPLLRSGCQGCRASSTFGPRVSSGLSDVKRCYFGWKTEYKEARQEVINRIQFVQLSPGLQAQLSPWNAIGEVFRYRVVGKGYTLKDLKTAEDWIHSSDSSSRSEGVIDVYELRWRDEAVPRRGRPIPASRPRRDSRTSHRGDSKLRTRNASVAIAYSWASKATTCVALDSSVRGRPPSGTSRTSSSPR